MKQEFSARTAALDDRLGVGRCFDMTARDLTIGGRRARLWVVNGYAQENILERMIAQWLSLPDLTAIPTLDAFLSRCVTACDAAVCRSREEAVLGVFSGRTLLVVDGFCGGILMDVKQFPTRSIEALSPRQFWNPFPKVRYTERPDVATACIMEGDVVVMVDNSPSALLLPTTLLRFTEEINDYYFPPLIGSYLQIVRMVVLLLTVFVTPVWYLLVKNPDSLHENLRFLLVQDAYYVPLIIQLLLVELIIDVLKLASLNTPDVLSNSFSMIGALILGDFAVQARWLVPEVLVYMAFVAIANYAQHSYEMGYATKLCRMLLLILIWLFDLWGFLAGIVGTLTLMATTKPLVGKGYLYPLIPFDGKKLKRLLHRVPISRDNS